MTRNSNLPPYVDHPGDQSILQPFYLGKCTFWGWILEGNQQNLQSLCDRNLNIPRLNGESLEEQELSYQAFTDFVLLAYDTTDYVRGSKNFPRSSVRGITPIYKEPNELFFCFPCRAVNKKEGTSRLVWHMPFCYLGDSEPAITTGREVYGFPKAWAEFELSPKDLNSKSDEIESIKMSSQWTFRVELENEEPVETRELITIQKINDQFSLAVSFLDHLMNIFTSVTDPFFDLFDVSVSVNSANLKQFRDVEDGTRACYQEILEAPFVASDLNLQNVDIQGKYEITVKNIASNPFVTALGLQGEVVEFTEPDGYVIEGRKQTARAFVNRSFDFSLLPGKVIWKSN